jgi:hypothetical protein
MELLLQIASAPPTFRFCVVRLRYPTLTEKRVGRANIQAVCGGLDYRSVLQAASHDVVMETN